MAYSQVSYRVGKIVIIYHREKSAQRRLQPIVKSWNITSHYNFCRLDKADKKPNEYHLGCLTKRILISQCTATICATQYTIVITELRTEYLLHFYNFWQSASSEFP